MGDEWGEEKMLSRRDGDRCGRPTVPPMTGTFAAEKTLPLVSAHGPVSADLLVTGLRVTTALLLAVSLASQ